MDNIDDTLKDLNKRKNAFVDEIERWLRQSKRSNDEILAKVKELKKKYRLPQAPIFKHL